MKKKKMHDAYVLEFLEGEHEPSREFKEIMKAIEKLRRSLL